MIIKILIKKVRKKNKKVVMVVKEMNKAEIKMLRDDKQQTDRELVLKEGKLQIPKNKLYCGNYQSKQPIDHLNKLINEISHENHKNESPIYFHTIYIIDIWSVLTINNPILKYIYHP